MRDMPKMMSLTYALAAIAFFLPMTAHAFIGAVKVACGDNNCNNVNLGQICDTLSLGSQPVAVSCAPEIAIRGPGTQRPCGAQGGICWPFGALIRGDLMGAYCFGSAAGTNNDAIVMCDTTPREVLSPADERRGKEE